MPRAVAPPPSGEFEVRLTKPFEGPPKHTVEVIGEPNRPASVKVITYDGHHASSEKVGDMPADDVNELMNVINQVRGFPSHQSKDVYGLDTRVEFNTFEIQWSNQDEDPTAGDVSEVASETKSTFKDVVDSLEALGRQFAKRDSEI